MGMSQVHSVLSPSSVVSFFIVRVGSSNLSVFHHSFSLCVLRQFPFSLSLFFPPPRVERRLNRRDRSPLVSPMGKGVASQEADTTSLQNAVIFFRPCLSVCLCPSHFTSPLLLQLSPFPLFFSARRGFRLVTTFTSPSLS